MQTLQQRITSSVTNDERGCWRWTRYLDRDGYGRAKVGGRPLAAHRVSYEAFIGPIPDGMQIDHLCRVRDCVNPFHLEPVTAVENTRRGVRISADACLRGHARSPENVKINRATGFRSCRICTNMKAAERRARKIVA